MGRGECRYYDSRSTKDLVNELMSDAVSYLLIALGCGLVVLLYLWILQIEPYVRRRTRTSTLFFLPWAPWKDYLDGVRLIRRYPNRPWFFTAFRWLTFVEIGGVLACTALWILERV